MTPRYHRAEAPERLYGQPWDESLCRDMADVLDYIENTYEVEDLLSSTFVIEEHSVHPPTDHMPPTDWMLEHVAEWVCKNGMVDEGMSDDVYDASKHPDTVAACDAMLATFASQIRYRMADRVLRTMDATYGTDGVWTVDGVRQDPVPATGDPDALLRHVLTLAAAIALVGILVLLVL